MYYIPKLWVDRFVFYDYKDRGGVLIRGLCKKKRMVYANKLFAKQTISINTLQKLYTNVENNIKLTAQFMLNAYIIDYLFIYKVN